MKGGFSLGLVIALLSFGSAAIAQPTKSEEAQAGRLFDDAQALMKAGKYADACPKYAESQKLDPQLGTELHLGECYLKAGKLASAWAAFKKAAELAAARKDRRESAARTEVVKLGPRVPRLVVSVGSWMPEDLEVRQDGELVDRSTWGARLPVDLGKHTITAKAPGFEPWTHEVDVPDSGPAVRVEVPDLVREEARPATVLVEAPASMKPSEPTEPQDAQPEPKPTKPSPAAPRVETFPPVTSSAGPEPPPSGATGRTAGYVLGGLGVAGIMVGAISKGMALAKQSDISVHCVDKACDQRGLDAVSAASTFQTVGYASMLIGGAALGTGIALVVSNPSNGDARASMRPMVLHGGAGLSVGGRF